MSVLVVVLTLVLLAAVIAVVSRPLLTTRGPGGVHAGKSLESPETPARAELEAAREAKYREIRDAELDYRTGKLSNEDYQAVNGALRAEAVEILDRLERLEREQGSAGLETSGLQEGAPARLETPGLQERGLDGLETSGQEEQGSDSPK